MNENNTWNGTYGTTIENELAAAKAELEIVKAEAEVIKADAEATKAEAEALMAEAEAVMAEAKALMAEAEALVAENKNANSHSGQIARTSNRGLAQKSPQPTMAASQIVGAEAISTIEEKGKLSKDRIVLYHNEYQELGITNFRATVIKDYSYDSTATFMVNGEYDGKTKKRLLIIVMVFNSQNELIGADFDERINENIRSHKTYSTSVTLPSKENIARVEVKIVKDPSYWD